MVTKQLAEWARKNGYRYIHNENEDYNVIEKRTEEGYAFSLCSEEDTTSSSAAAGVAGALGAIAMSQVARKYVVRLSVDDKTWNKEMWKSLKQELKGIATPAYVKGQLSFSMKKNSHKEETYNNMNAAVITTSRFLSGHGVKMPDTCVHCGQGYCDDFDTTKKTGSCLGPAHASCVRQKQREALEKLEKSKKNERYFPALLLLIPGIIVGCIPAVIALIGGFYGSIINLIMFFLIPIIALPFYRKANGTAKWGVIPVILILTMLTTTILVVVGDILWVGEQYGRISLDLYIIGLRRDLEYMITLILEVMVSWIPGIIGVIIAYVSLKRKNKSRDARLEALREVSRQSLSGFDESRFRNEY